METTAPMTPPSCGNDQRHSRQGFAAALVAFFIWGAAPIFFHSLGALSPFEVVAHRVIWTVIPIGIIVLWTGRLADVLAILRHPSHLLAFAGSAFAIAINWTLYIYAVTHGHGKEASMGYYIFPLTTVLLTALFLKEKFTSRQRAGLIVVGVGVAVMGVGPGQLPWIPFVLAFAFSVYGLLRKLAPADSLVGLFVETLLLLPIAVGFLLHQHLAGQGLTHLDHADDLWLFLVVGTPLWTGLPLFLFAFGTRHLRLSTVGVMQYVNPTCQVLIATLLYHEVFTLLHAIVFGLIWLGVAVYSWPVHKKGPVSKGLGIT